MKFPQRIELEVDAGLLAPGLAGYVQAIGAALRHQGLLVNDDDLMCASASSFATYAYSPEINKHEDPRRYSYLGEQFSNFGVFESLGYYCNSAVAEVNQIPDDEFWKLVRFELNLGRPLITTELGRGDGAVLIVGYEDHPGVRRLILWDSERRVVDLQKDEKPQGESEVFVNFAVVVRAGGPFAPNPRMKVTALRWACNHARKWTEFFHETRENYLVGFSGGRFIADMAETSMNAEEAAWFDSHVKSRIETRAAAGRVLGRWEVELTQAFDAPIGMLRAAASDYTMCANLLTERNYAQALAVEEEAIRKLEAYVPSLPPTLG